jgi:hypothetical protein
MKEPKKKTLGNKIDYSAIEYAKYMEAEWKAKEERKRHRLITFDEEFKSPLSDELEKLIDATYVSQDSNYSAPAVILQIKRGTEYCNVLSLENISTLIGKAKSRKTMLISLLIGSLISENKEDSVFKAIKVKKKRILVFDTEQSKDQAMVTYERVKQIINRNLIENVSVFSLRSLTPYERLDAITKLIEYFKDTLLLVVIDGIRDLIYDINNIAESTELVTKLMKLSEDNKIHILNVIHQNKSDNNARGHIGTELINKSEAVITVTKKNEETSEVSPFNSRHITFDPFKFGVDKSGIPYLMEFVKETPRNQISNVSDPQKLDITFHQDFLSAVFSNTEIVGYTMLKETVKYGLMKVGFDVGYSTVAKLISFYFKNGLIKNEGKSRPKKYYL